MEKSPIFGTVEKLANATWFDPLPPTVSTTTRALVTIPGYHMSTTT